MFFEKTRTTAAASKKATSSPHQPEVEKVIGALTIYKSDWTSMDPGQFITDTIIDAFRTLVATTREKVVLNVKFLP